LVLEVPKAKGHMPPTKRGVMKATTSKIRWVEEGRKGGRGRENREGGVYWGTEI